MRQADRYVYHATEITAKPNKALETTCGNVAKIHLIRRLVRVAASDPSSGRVSACAVRPDAQDTAPLPARPRVAHRWVRGRGGRTRLPMCLLPRRSASAPGTTRCSRTWSSHETAVSLTSTARVSHRIQYTSMRWRYPAWSMSHVCGSSNGRGGDHTVHTRSPSA